MKRSKGNFQSISGILDKYDWDKKKYISREFQDYGYRLAVELNDERHKAIYIKMAKIIPRSILEEARLFIKDSYNVRNKGRLFMWKVGKLRKENEKKE